MEKKRPGAPRILFWDIETAQNLVAVFQLGNNDWIDPSNIIRERYVICASWMWDGEEKIHSVSVLDNPTLYKKDPYNDYHVLKVLHEVLSSADVIVAHNGDAFDKKYIDTRLLVHGFSPLPPIYSLDTYKVAKNRFNFNSNKLDYIARLLKVGKKIKTTPGLWMRIIQGDSKAIREMVVYNKHDVEILRKVFIKLRPYVSNHINRELFGVVGCPYCGHSKVQSRGVYYALTRVYRRWQCQSSKCMGWFKSTKAEPGSAKFRIL